MSVTPRALGSAEATIAASRRGYSSSSPSSSSPAKTKPAADGSPLLLRPSLWPLPRSTRGVASFERPSLSPRSFSIGTRLRGAGSDSKMVEVQGEGGEETQDFAKAQRPNLDPEVGEYGKALADKAERVRELLGEHLEQGVDLEVGSLLFSFFLFSPIFLCVVAPCSGAQTPKHPRKCKHSHTRARTHAHTHTRTHAHTRTNARRMAPMPHSQLYSPTRRA